jgi:hypothetical protein
MVKMTKINDIKQKFEKKFSGKAAQLVISFVVFILTNKIVQSQDTIFYCNFDSDRLAGWTTGASGIYGGLDKRNSWSFGIPHGGRGYDDFPGQPKFIGNPDPVTDHTSANNVNNVAGQGLKPEDKKEGVSSHYNRSNEWIITPPIKCSNYVNTRLTFWRWANFEKNYDKAIVEISTDGMNWINLGHPLFPEDTEWNEVTFNIAPYADHADIVFIRWRSESDAFIHYSGWNIDDVLITGKLNLNNFTSIIKPGNLNIPYEISSTVDSVFERIDVFDFIIEDAGSGDRLPTIIDTLIITAGNGNTISNWKQAIAAAFLFGPDLGEVSGKELQGKIYENKIVFGGNQIINVADNAYETYRLRVYLRKNLSAVSDNSNFEFALNYRDIIENENGSFISNGLVESGDDKLRIDIDATMLAFVVEPDALAFVNSTILPEVIVAARDMNGNTDLDFVSDIIITNSNNLKMSDFIAKAQSGRALFTALQFNETGGPVTLTATCNNPNIKSVTSIGKITIFDDALSVIYTEDFDKNILTGWTSGATYGNNSWVHGAPHGGRGYSDYPSNKGFVGNPDPVYDHSANNNINNVYGQGLSYSSKFEGVSSHYNNAEEWLKSPAINCASFINTRLKFWRWANFESDYDKAFVEISTDNINWTDLGQPLYPQDNNWVYVEIDISKFADRKSTVYIRWRSLSDRYIHYAGWNIDDISVEGVYSPMTNWTGAISAEWNNAGNWSNNRIPDKYTTVGIQEGVSQNPVITGNATCREITIGKGKVLNIQAGGSLTVYGNCNIETDNSSYGSILDYGKITVNGRLNIKRYIPAKGWYYFSSPVQNYAANKINNMVYTFNEPLACNDWSKGWQKTNGVMDAAKGYDVYFAKTDSVLFSGCLNTGTQQIMLTYTNGNEIAEHEGWNLVGNPYAAAIDWDAPSGWTKENIENAIYIWDEAQGNFRTYVNGVGTNGGSRFIPPMQGFFVKVSAPGNARLAMTNEIKAVAGASRTKRTAQGFAGIKLSVAQNGFSDETVVAFRDEATMAFDGQFDAYKKFTDNTNVPQIYSLSVNKEQLAINSVSENNEYIQIPIEIKAVYQGNVKLNFTGAIETSGGKTIYLEDKNTGRFVNLLETSEYQFETSLTDVTGRFILHIGMPLSVSYAKTDATCNGSSDGKIDVTVMGGKLPYQYILWSNGSDEEDIENLPAGEYKFIVVDADNNTSTETIKIDEPAPANLTINAYPPTSKSASDGYIDLIVNDMSAGYCFLWSTNETTEDIFNLKTGVYSVVVSDQKGCKTTATVELNNLSKSFENVSDQRKPVDIYAYCKNINIIFHESLNSDAKAEVIDLSGKFVNTYSLNSTSNVIETTLPEGCYIIKVINNGQQFSEKIVLQ